MGIGTSCFPLLQPRFISASGTPEVHRSGRLTSAWWVSTGNVFLAQCQPLRQQERGMEYKELQVTGQELWGHFSAQKTGKFTVGCRSEGYFTFSLPSFPFWCTRWTRRHHIISEGKSAFSKRKDSIIWPPGNLVLLSSFQSTLPFSCSSHPYAVPDGSSGSLFLKFKEDTQEIS